MKNLFKNFIFLITIFFLPEISFSQIMYPGTPELVGSEEDFWVWATDSCKYTMTPDGSVRAYKIKKNGNPDELWRKPFFTRENDDRNNEDWDPSC